MLNRLPHPFVTQRLLLAIALLASLAACGDAVDGNASTGAGTDAATATASTDGSITSIGDKRMKRSRSGSTAIKSATTTTTTASTSVTNAIATLSPTPTTTTSPVAAVAWNSIDVIVSDMTLASDFAPPGYANWFATLNYPTPLTAPNYRLSGMAMDSIAPWLVIGRGAADQSTNTRVEARNEKTYVLYANGTWQQISSGRPTGRQRSNTPFADSGAGDEIVVDSTTTSVSVPVGHLQEMWAGLGQVSNWQNVIGFFATAEVRLVMANSALPDDRANAKWSAQIGCDWWNYAGYLATGNFMLYDNPGGSGRFKQITNDWQSVNVVNMKAWMTSSKGPPEDPSWSIENPYQWPRDASHPLGVALTEAYVRSNPPPF